MDTVICYNDTGLSQLGEEKSGEPLVQVYLCFVFLLFCLTQQLHITLLN
jgi:hypothetical protein